MMIGVRIGSWRLALGVCQVTPGIAWGTSGVAYEFRALIARSIGRYIRRGRGNALRYRG